MEFEFDLLQQASKVFQEIAEFYVSDNAVALRARKKVERRSRAEGGHSYFHAALLSRLVALNDILDRTLQRARRSSNPDIGLVVGDTLRLLDELVQDLPDTDDDQTRAYAGLGNLIRLHERDQQDVRSRKPLGFRICLFCPSPESQVLLKEQLLRCANVFASSTCDPAVTTDLDPDLVLSETKHIQEWKPPANFTKNSQRLHRFLLPWLQFCPCGFPHEQTRTSVMGAQLGGILSRHYDFCYPHGPFSADPSWRTLRLQGENFARPARSQLEIPGQDQRSVRPPEPTSWHNHHSFCDMANDSRGMTDLVVVESGLRVGKSSVPVQQISTGSLKEYLASGSRHSPRKIGNKRAITLALVLSYTYLHLSDTSWWPNTEVCPDFWFAQSASGELVVQRPFLGIDTTGVMTRQGTSVEELINRQRPSLPAFGKLLLEIWAGRSVDWADLPSAIKECGEDCLGSYWLCAVQACLGDDSTLKTPGGIREAGAVRDMFVRKVIKSLQWLSEKLCQQSPEDIFAPKSETPEQPRQTPPRGFRGRSIATNSREAVGPNPQPAIRADEQRASRRESIRDGPKRLINVRTLRLEEFTINDSWPDYAILSHRWSAAEVSFAELQQDRSSSQVEEKVGWSKIVGACRQARGDGITHIWVDSCCINKASDSELNEALNSMFRWYRDAQVCYVYLADVPKVEPPQDSEHLKRRRFDAMSRSEWFQRGWTLQELLAPRSLKFFSADWSSIGKLSEMSRIIWGITKIDPLVLEGRKAISDYSVAQRFSWAAHRKTTKVEDEAYCLLGLFGVSLDARYGIGRLAFDELQRKILESGRGDDSLFAWDSDCRPQHRSFFAGSPADFKDCGDVVLVRPRKVRMNISCRSDGVGGRLSVYYCNEEEDGWSGPAAVLNCRRNKEFWDLLAIRLKEVSPALRVDEHNDYQVAFEEDTEQHDQAGFARYSRLILVPQRSAVAVEAREATILMGSP